MGMSTSLVVSAIDVPSGENMVVRPVDDRVGRVRAGEGCYALSYLLAW